MVAPLTSLTVSEVPGTVPQFQLVAVPTAVLVVPVQVLVLFTVTWVDDEGNIWFFTNEYSPKASEISVENTVSLTYSDVKAHTYLSIVAEAALVDDKVKMKELWNPFIKAFFPEGLDDPQLTLLKIVPTDAEYWDSSSSSMVVLFNMLKAALNGKQYDEGKHGKIEL